jgi:flagellar biosynthesis anti-sigma factor FlgM
MRIDLNAGPQPLSETSRSNAGNVAASSSFTGKVPGAEDQTELSGAHIQVQTLVAQASQLPEIREERVSALRQAVQSGHYRTTPEKVAGAIFAHMIAGPAA